MIGPISAIVVATVLGVVIKVTHSPRDSIGMSAKTDSSLRRIDREHALLRARARSSK